MRILSYFRLVTNKMTPYIHNQRGVVLLLTLVILVLLVAVIVEFDYGTKIDLITAGNFRNDVQASYIAKAGIHAAESLLKDDLKHPNRYTYLKIQPCIDLGAIPVGEATASATICDESAKLSVNLLQKPVDYAKWKPIWERLFKELEIEPGLVNAVKDWVDDDSEITAPFGAESDYYQQLQPPYSCKNGPMDGLGELRMVRGITDEVYKKLVTGCDGKPCITVALTNKVNLNTISVQACQALHEDLTESCCQDLVSSRPITNITDLPACWGGVGGGTASSSGIRFELVSRGIPIATDSDFFSIHSTGTVNELQHTIDSLIQRHSPKLAILSWEE
jgi:general secretion pathway protein K